MNNPMSAVDLSGLACYYVDAQGNVSVDNWSADSMNQGLCGQDGGNWYDGYLDPDDLQTMAANTLFFNGQGNAVQVQFDQSGWWTGVEQVYPGDLSNTFSLVVQPQTVAYTGVLIIDPYGWGIGPAISGADVPSQHLWCLGGGVGVSLGHSISAGPVSVNAQDAKEILSGGSLSWGYNISPLEGIQASVNSSGTTAGYSIGTPGLSAAATYSGCWHY
jgi:hypothetical protein